MKGLRIGKGEREGMGGSGTLGREQSKYIIVRKAYRFRARLVPLYVEHLEVVHMGDFQEEMLQLEVLNSWGKIWRQQEKSRSHVWVGKKHDLAEGLSCFHNPRRVLDFGIQVASWVWPSCGLWDVDMML